LSAAAVARIEAAHAVVRSVVAGSIRAYGVNTGVGALSDVIIPREQQSALSRNILMSHAVGMGAPLDTPATRAIMVAAVNNFALGHSGLRLCVVQRLVDLLNAGCVPVVPRQGSVGYISHSPHIGLSLIGQGKVVLRGERLPAAEALRRLGLEPLVLEAKEGLCLVNGTPCVTGLAALVLHRSSELMNWTDAVAAMSFETQRCQLRAIDPSVMALRVSPGLQEVTAKLNELLAGSNILANAHGRKTQDALSLRAIPQVHGAVRDAWSGATIAVDRELASCTDNPIVGGSPDMPEIFSQAHPVGAALGLAMDHVAAAVAELGMNSERRLDRMVNPLVSGLPAFLAHAGGPTSEGSASGGTASGFMIAQYAAASLVGENRRLGAPAGLDGGITSALQEDMLCHATPAALKALDIIDNVRSMVAIELLAACQSYDLLGMDPRPAPRTWALYRALRAKITTYADDRPLSDDIAASVSFIDGNTPDDILSNAMLVTPKISPMSPEGSV
jgi:histidine ammonia-lyase